MDMGEEEGEEEVSAVIEAGSGRARRNKRGGASKRIQHSDGSDSEYLPPGVSQLSSEREKEKEKEKEKEIERESESEGNTDMDIDAIGKENGINETEGSLGVVAAMGSDSAPLLLLASSSTDS